MPTRTFEGELSLSVGNKTVRLIQVGPAHTRGDVLAYVPEDRAFSPATSFSSMGIRYLGRADRQLDQGVPLDARSRHRDDRAGTRSDHRQERRARDQRATSNTSRARRASATTPV